MRSPAKKLYILLCFKLSTFTHIINLAALHLFLTLQFKPMDVHNVIKVTVLWHTSSYMFWAPRAHHQGVHNCT